jgi:hypothetical protein
VIAIALKEQPSSSTDAAGDASGGNNALIPFASPLGGDTVSVNAQPEASAATTGDENNNESPEARAEREKKERLAKLEPTMSFVSGGVYFSGKLAKRMPALRMSDNKIMLIPSPRAGVAQIGKPLFEMAGDMTPEQQKEHEYVLTAMRLSVYFHEARHSDGHGKSLGFMHAICPQGHDYEGLPACDSSLNGAYTVGAEILKTFLKNCKNCSEADQQVLALMYLDSTSRVMPTVDELESDGSVKKAKPKVWDAAPEGLSALADMPRD